MLSITTFCIQIFIQKKETYTQNQSVCYHPNVSCSFRRLNELRTIANPLAVGSSDRRVERLLRAINLQPSLSAAHNRTTTSSTFLSKTGNEQMCQYSKGGGGFRVDRYFCFCLFCSFFLPQCQIRFGSSKPCCSCCSQQNCQCWTAFLPLLKEFIPKPAKLLWPTRIWLSLTHAWNESCLTPFPYPSQSSDSSLEAFALWLETYLFMYSITPVVCSFILFFSRLDEWLSAAADCLELFPDQLIVVAGEQLSLQCGNASLEDPSAEHMTSKKRLLFDTIAKYYSGQEKSPLISGRYLDIHIAVLNLLGKNQKS